MLGRKQRSSQSDWIATLDSLVVDEPHIEALAARTVARVRDVCDHREAAFGWSGGKDSLALEQVMYDAGVRRCVMVITNLEYRAFLAWITDHMPWELELINVGFDLDWLASHPDMLFPQKAAVAGQWFHLVQHEGQRQYYFTHALDVIALGRRRADGNFIGRDGDDLYAAKGITRFSPLADWTHEDVLMFLKHRGVELPPIYWWPNGFRVGTGPWAARQYTGDEANGWREVASIDRSIVVEAASRFPLAQAAL